MPDPQRVRQCLDHGLPPFSADSLVREDAWLAYPQALLQRYQPPAQPAVENAVATLRERPTSGSSRRGRLPWSAASSPCCRRRWCHFWGLRCKSRGAIGC